jgi:inosine-uridine nucleoside N-ribohydrolase
MEAIMKQIPLYIDTDMGVDDIVALCMIIASKKFEIRGISVVNGVSPLKTGVTNLNRILTYLDIQCPIFTGANQNEQGSSAQFPVLDRTRAKTLALLPDVPLPKEGKNPVLPLSFMKKKIELEVQPITFFAIGPLTNIPCLLSVSKGMKTIRLMVIMGGTVYAKGIVPPKYRTEYNIRLDPKNAAKVLNSNIPIILIPLDATRCVPTKVEDTTGEMKETLTQFYDELKTICPRTKEAYIARSIILNNERDFSNFYDPLAAAILIDQKLIRKQITGMVSVRTNKKNMGEIVMNPKNTGQRIIIDTYSKLFLAQLMELLKKR